MHKNYFLKNKMRNSFIILISITISLSLAIEKKNPVFEVSPESTETQSVLDIKQFVTCAKNIKDFPDISNFINVLEHKKGYQKQLDYIKRVVPHNKEATLCKKSARKAVPKYLDLEKFAL